MNDSYLYKALHHSISAYFVINVVVVYIFSYLQFYFVLRSNSGSRFGTHGNKVPDTLAWLPKVIIKLLMSFSKLLLQRNKYLL